MPTIETINNTKALKDFMSVAQLNTMANGTRNSEEREFFVDKLAEMANIVNTMPKTYETDGQGDAAIVSLHYFTGNADWYIVEKDSVDGEPQYQAFGRADIGMGLSGGGYISIDEITNTYGAELDLFFTPCTVGELIADKK